MYIIGIPDNVSVGNPANFTFITFGNGESIGNANITIDGAAITTGVTDMNGTVLLTVNAIAIPGLVISANPTSITSNTPTYVTFTVTAGSSAVTDALVNLTGTASGSGITNPNGQVILYINSTSSGAITATATKNGYSAGSVSLSAIGQQSHGVSASPANVTNGVATYVTFTVASGGSALGGATISVSGGGIIADGVTNSAGQAKVLLNAGASGTISVTARKAGYVEGLTTIAH